MTPELPRVAMVFASDFNTVSAGGIMTLLGQLIARLSHRFSVLFVGVGTPDDRDAVPRRIGVPSMAVFLVLSPWRKPAWLPLNIAFTAGLFRKRREICRSTDLIHAHRMENALPFVMRKSKPVILTVHGTSKFHAVTQTGPLRWGIVRLAYDLVEGFVFSRADRVVLVSGEAHEYYIKRHPHLRHKFVVIPNFIEFAEFQRIDRTTARTVHRLTDSDTAIVYAGRLVAEKQVDVLIEAFARMCVERPSTRLFIAGEGPDEPRLRHAVESRRLMNIHFLGLLPKPAMHTLLAAADVLVLPSRFEGFPMVALEALAYGVPVVASDVGGIREILDDGLSRFIWHTGDPEELGRKMQEAVDVRAQIRDLCIARARAFETSQVLPRLEEVYASLISGSGRR